ncbi:MAG: L-serine ammonia-lyase [Terriglobales bacterium]
MKTSFFELFKIGIGPSSSHTVGPMRAAREFVLQLHQEAQWREVLNVRVELYGSLALTGKGHGTDRAIILGLMGEQPDQVDPASIEHKQNEVRRSGALMLNGSHLIEFDETRDIIFHLDKTLPAHSNAMRFTALNSGGNAIASDIYYSVGGGFIQKEGDDLSPKVTRPEVPFPFSSADELLRIGEERGLAIWQIALANEASWKPESEVRAYVARVWKAMEECLDRGLRTEGILPGGLKVRRRAPALFQKLSGQSNTDPLAPMDWVNAFAMAVNEENAAGARVVTAPTNGAAGIIPAVGHYYRQFVPESSEGGIFQYLLTAGAIGILYKENASISGAEVGCQGEVGVACSMAAGGLVAALGGDNQQIEYAAEIGMEHNLGMTCDPIGGLVQIPCIERNAMGAVKAINACRIAMRETGDHKVSLDQVIKTMYQTGLDMKTHYKETSLGGLALNLIEC